ncbi:S-layer family protein [Nostoc sp. CHAB 5844]|nr:S-layer family protein [Nostoc sp. CHAB 5844]
MTHICWQLHLGAILAISGTLVTTSIQSSLAQSITLDGTLGTTQTINGPNYTIPQSVGQTVGSNLFHSFGRFSLNTGESAVFQSGADIRNILSRVTGGLPSIIDGLITTQSNNVNLFFINPSGIVFGPNARLNVGGTTRGSFIATTADALVWSNGSQFSATNPGGVSSLLTIIGDPSGFLFNRRPPQAIDVTDGELRVDQGQSLLLLGGNINLDDSLLVVDSPVGGKIGLGSVGAPGTVGLTTNGNILSLNFPANLARADVSLSNNSQVNVFAEVGGSININARNLNLQGGSQIETGIPQGTGDINTRAGDINVNTTGDIRLQQQSMISTAVERNATGNAGNINIVTNSLLGTDGSQVNASSFGQGNGGSITITANDAVAFDGVASDDSISSVISYIDAGAEGNGGIVNINARSLTLTNGAQVSASVRAATDTLPGGRGNAGNVNINVRDAINISGIGANTTDSGIFSLIGVGAEGRGGNIEVNTGSLTATNGGQVNASVFGRGDGGSIAITASGAVAFDGVASDGSISSAISYIDAGAEGNGGIVNINARSLTLTNGAQVSASVRAATDTLPGGRGNAGNVNVNVRDTITINDPNSGVLSLIGVGAEGNGGNIAINTNSLTATNGGQVNTSVFGRGDGGRISITANDAVAFDGVASNGSISSAISYIDAGAEGDGGQVNVNARSLTLTNGGQVSASVRSATDTLPGGRGDAGNVEINVRDITVSGRSANATRSGILSLVGEGAEGSGGNLSIATTNLAVRDGAEVTVSNRGIGDAGNISANARIIALDNQGQITATSESGQGGDVSLQVSDILLLRRNSLISHVSGTPEAGGTGGNFSANAGFIVAVPSENSDIITNAFNGSGGNIIINAQNIFGLQFQPQLTLGSDIVATGTITLNTPNIDPVQGLVYLPATVDVPEPIAQSCNAFNNQKGSQFNVTGRGGLPPNPNEILSSDVVWSDTRITSTNTQARAEKNSPNTSKFPVTASINPATSWVFNQKGEVTLLAHTANNSAVNLKLPSVTCRQE